MFELPDERLRKLHQLCHFVQEFIVSHDLAANPFSGLLRSAPDEFPPLCYVQDNMALPEIFAVALQVFHLDLRGIHEPVAPRSFPRMHVCIDALHDIFSAKGNDPFNRPGKGHIIGRPPHGLGKGDFGNELGKHLFQKFPGRKTGLLPKDTQVFTFGRLLYRKVPHSYSLPFCKALGSPGRISLCIVSNAFGGPDRFGPDGLLPERHTRYIQNKAARRTCDRGDAPLYAVFVQVPAHPLGHRFQGRYDVAGRQLFGPNFYV